MYINRKLPKNPQLFLFCRNRYHQSARDKSQNQHFLSGRFLTEISDAARNTSKPGECLQTVPMIYAVSTSLARGALWLLGHYRIWDDQWHQTVRHRFLYKYQWFAVA